MIKLQLTNDFQGFVVDEIKRDGKLLEKNEFNAVLSQAKTIFKYSNQELTLKKGTEIILSALIRDDLYIDVLIQNVNFKLQAKLNDFLSVTQYQPKFIKYVVKHNDIIGDIEIEREYDPNWESFLDTLFCQRDEEGNRPCEYCNENCKQQWVESAFKHYIDMQTYSIPVLAE